MNPTSSSTNARNAALRRTVSLVAILNLAYFGVEFAVARRIGSVSLLADSVDFLEDASVNTLILFALGWSAARRSQVGMVMAGILLMPGLATIWEAFQKFQHPSAPEAWALSLTGAGALAVNLFCAFRLARVRTHSGSLTRAAWLSSRNDAIANVAIIASGVLTAITRSQWPDLGVGLAIFGLNIGAAREVYEAARKERSQTL